ncbi:MAG: hypothetical protein AB7K52_08960 [Phycisphaerales bacterium]
MANPDSTWLKSLERLVQEHLGAVYPTGEAVKVSAELELASGFQVSDYTSKGARHKIIFNQADLVVLDEGPHGKWKPRVAMECRQGELSSREVLAANARAEQFKLVQPYLRFGLLIGRFEGLSLPYRVLKHGPHFDFVVAWEGPTPKGMTRDRLGAIIVAEIDASRALSSLLLKEGTAAMGPIRMLHRPLTLA